MRTILIAAVLWVAACSGGADDDVLPDVDGAVEIDAAVDSGIDGFSCAPTDRDCVCRSPGTVCWTCQPGTIAHTACIDACVANTTPTDTWCP